MPAWTPTIAASNARRVAHFGLERGLPLRRLLLACPALQSESAAERVPARNMFALWTQLVAACDPALPIQIAQRSSLEDLQLLGFTLITAPTLRHALESFVRCSALLSDAFSWQLQLGPRTAEVRWHSHVPVDLGVSVALETSLAQFISGVRALAGADIDPLRVSFGHAAPARSQAHRAHFRCRIEWQSDAYRLVIARHVLDAAPPQANPRLFRYLHGQAEALLRELEPQPLAARVEREITRGLSNGRTPRLPELALRLGMSERNLRRQLAAEALSFRDLIDRARRERARELLTQSELPIASIAYELGFATASSLNHACQRWFSCVPSEVAAATATRAASVEPRRRTSA